MSERSTHSTQCSIQKLSSGEQNYHNFKNVSNDSLGKLQQHKDISLVGKDTINHSDLVLKPLSQRKAETSQFNETIDEIEKGENNQQEIQYESEDCCSCFALCIKLMLQ